jgi:hypothetical protein
MLLIGGVTILWPIPMYGTGYVFFKGFYYTGWIVHIHIGVLWGNYEHLLLTLAELAADYCIY